MHRTAAVVLTVVLLAGCEVSARVNIDVRRDGSGTVGAVIELDADAVRTLEEPGAALEEAVLLEDLEAAGWDVSWERTGDSATLRLAKGFGRPEDLTGVVEELAGRGGPLRDVELAVEDRFLETSYDLLGRADLSALTTGIAEDPELVARLAAERVDVVALESHLSGQLADALHLEVAVSLPGRDRNLVGVEPGADSDLATSSTVRDWRRIGLLVGAGAFAVLAVVVLVAGRQNRRRAPNA